MGRFPQAEGLLALGSSLVSDTRQAQPGQEGSASTFPTRLKPGQANRGPAWPSTHCQTQTLKKAHSEPVFRALLLTLSFFQQRAKGATTRGQGTHSCLPFPSACHGTIASIPSTRPHDNPCWLLNCIPQQEQAFNSHYELPHSQQESLLQLLRHRALPFPLTQASLSPRPGQRPERCGQ